VSNAPALRAVPAASPLAEAVSAASGPIAAPTRSNARKRLGFAAIVLAALSGAAWYGYDWYTIGRFTVSTDDAYVKTDMSSLGAKVAGYVTGVPFGENARVRAGDVVLKLDDGDYVLAVQSAEARIAVQKATIARMQMQANAQVAKITSAEAQLRMAEAQSDYANAVLDRQQSLLKQKAASQQAVDDAKAKANWNAGAAEQAKAGLQSAQAEADVIAAQIAEAEAAMVGLNTALAEAKRNLSFTEIRAPFEGIIANRSVEDGQYVSAGQRVMALVPLTETYIEANFKETQIANLVPGQKAQITVDAFNGETIEGRIESIAPASGAEFSLLPPENATGNFTKITQRVPVRIAVPLAAAEALRPGLSVSVSVNTGGQAPIQLTSLK
jgi:membrane fusion protein (multidrug efflux system)